MPMDDEDFDIEDSLEDSLDWNWLTESPIDWG
jgi:hypothetical protein